MTITLAFTSKGWTATQLWWEFAFPIFYIVCIIFISLGLLDFASLTYTNFPDCSKKAIELVREKESIPRSSIQDCRLIGLALIWLFFGIILIIQSRAKQINYELTASKLQAGDMACVVD